MSFISNPRAIAPSTASDPRTHAQPLTSSGAIRIVDGRHLLHVAPLGGMELDLSATDPADLVLHMQAQGRYVLDAILMHDLRGDHGGVLVTVRTLDVARGGGVVLVNAQPLSALVQRHALIRVAAPSDAIFEAPHLYVTLTGSGSGSVLIRALGTVVAPEDPENPMSDRRRIG